MIRMLPYRETGPGWALAFAAALLWLLICAVQLAHVIDHPSKLGICMAVALALLPFALLHMARIPMYLLAAYAVLVPFSSILELSGGQTLTKVLGISVGGSLILATIVKQRAALPSKALLAVLLLTAYAGLTICWSIDPALGLKSYGIYLSYVGLYVAIALYPATAGEMRLILIASLAGAIALSAYGGLLFWQGQQVYESRLGIGFANADWIDPNEYAAALLTPIAVILMMFMRSRSAYKKAAWLLVLLVVTFGFVASGSRGGLFALGAIVIVFAIRSRYRIQLLALVPPLVLAVIAGPIGHRLLQPDVLSADLRIDIWKVGLASLQQYWVAGAGIGNFSNAYAQYFLATPHAALSWNRVAHSIIVESVVEYGIPGLILVVMVWYTQFASLARLQLDDNMRDLSIALQAGVVALFIAGLSLNLMLAKYTWLAFSLIALVRSAVAASFVRIPVSVRPERERL